MTRTVPTALPVVDDRDGLAVISRTPHALRSIRHNGGKGGAGGGAGGSDAGAGGQKGAAGAQAGAQSTSTNTAAGAGADAQDVASCRRGLRVIADPEPTRRNTAH